MKIKIGDKEIQMDQALEYYYDQELCKRKFNLTDLEYRKLVSKMVKMIKKQKYPNSPPPNTFQQPQIPNTFEQPQIPNTFQQPQTPNTFEQPQTPNTFQQPQTPNTFQQPQTPNTFQQPQTLQQFQNDKNFSQNQGLFDRRFFQGFHTPIARPQPIRFSETSNQSEPTTDTNRIFSRMFDIPNKQLPDITSDRQQIGSRRW